jgi:hypothetical protein
MHARKRSELPASLLRLGERFAAWRKTRRSGQRIPEALWKSAVKLATKHGLNRTARALNLDYYCLKKRVDGASSHVASPFVELPSPPLSIMNECVIELEDATGSHMRVHVKGQDIPDVLALSRSFWNAD